MHFVDERTQCMILIGFGVAVCLHMFDVFVKILMCHAFCVLILILRKRAPSLVAIKGHDNKK